MPDHQHAFTTVMDKFSSELWGHHLVVPMDVSAYYLEHDIKRLLCTINERETFPCALMPMGEARYFILVNKERRRKMRLEKGDRVAVVLQPDQSKYGLPMPEELQELLQIDEEGNRLFHALTPGRQRNLLYIVGKPKRSETRVTKAVVVIEHLKRNRGEIDFKGLQEDFKNY